jgi:hypothetical protein
LDGALEGGEEKEVLGRGWSSREAVSEEKRVRNTAVKHVLLAAGKTLVAPTYREGLELIVRGDLVPFEKEDLDCLF